MMYTTIKPLILASQSPRRKDFLTDLGLNFTTLSADIDETPLPGELPEIYVERISLEKARAVSRNNSEKYILSADTAVCLGNRILGKPHNDDEAVEMLLALSGRRHVVMSGYCIMNEKENIEVVRSVSTEVHFIELSESVARGYVATGESNDKAGAYGIQGNGSFLVSKICGSYTNVVGLPMAEVVESMVELGVIGPAQSFFTG